MLVLNALGMATERRPSRDGLVMHSDRGVQFTSWAVSQKLRDAGISPSMGTSNKHLLKVADYVRRGDHRLALLAATFDELVSVLPELVPETEAEQHYARTEPDVATQLSL